MSRIWAKPDSFAALIQSTKYSFYMYIIHENLMATPTNQIWLINLGTNFYSTTLYSENTCMDWQLKNKTNKHFLPRNLHCNRKQPRILGRHQTRCQLASDIFLFKIFIFLTRIFLLIISNSVSIWIHILCNAVKILFEIYF
jgi:hypothetical protein